MRSTGLALLLVVTTASCSGPTRATTAAITVSAPASLPARVCTRCGGIPGELEAVADLVVEETAGVAGQVTRVGYVFSNASTTIDGPGEFSMRNFGATDLRIAARGTLTLREVGIRFAGSSRDQLPATLRFTVDFRDANNHRVSSQVSILITPP